MSTTICFRLADASPRLLALTTILLALAPGIAAATAARVTDSFTARFNVSRDSLGLGTATFALAAGTRAGCYIYTGQADPNALVSMFVGAIRDESRFCIESGIIRPQHFRHHVEAKPKKSYTLNFDWSAHRLHYHSEAGKNKTLTLPARALDPLSIHIAARRWVAGAVDAQTLHGADFPLAVKDEIKTYRLRASNAGTVDTPAGRFDTVLVERVDSDKHQLRFWLARGAYWMPVRVEQQKDDDAVFRMNLTSLSRERQARGSVTPR